MRIAFAAGGTGGPLYPAIAVAEALAAAGRAHDCFFFVSRRGVERRILEGGGFPFAELPACPVASAAPHRLLPAAARMLWAYRAARRLMRERNTEVLVGFGAYASVPPALAARALGLGLVIHEANAVMGRANRLLRRVAHAVALGMPQGDRRGETPGEVTGTPLRAGILRGADRNESRRLLGLAPDRFTLLVTGGSQGARALNGAAAGAAGAFTREGIQVLHLAGEEGCSEVREAYRLAGLAGAVLPYLGGMERAYAAADIAVCRAGAMTLAELAQAGLPAIAVPFPGATGNHQEANARFYERAGGVRVLPERDLTPGRLAELVIGCMRSRAEREAMSRAMRAAARPDAAARVAEIVERVAGRRRGGRRRDA
ncbi:MAG: undecaprenyldiphospho-muramoylpentapeptide beta-N-acetylglucosaminyltransferase [Candidatus Aureabacteria bacterium]|nr:undecaprenyldiphospho-muramoylpentapeptide beta-N-acetylglucosaminyltransferase [Candidatus Auribacterota bacterium]